LIPLRISGGEEKWLSSSVMNNIKKPSVIPPAANYHMFKFGVKPMWEEEQNKDGGKWTFSHDRGKRGGELDRHWINTV
jgi:translation initiation factor 4E